jgi:hypothetical protein
MHTLRDRVKEDQLTFIKGQRKAIEVEMPMQPTA